MKLREEFIKKVRDPTPGVPHSWTHSLAFGQSWASSTASSNRERQSRDPKDKIEQLQDPCTRKLGARDRWPTSTASRRALTVCAAADNLARGASDTDRILHCKYHDPRRHQARDVDRRTRPQRQRGRGARRAGAAQACRRAACSGCIGAAAKIPDQRRRPARRDGPRRGVRAGLGATGGPTGRGREREEWYREIQHNGFGGLTPPAA